MKRAALGAAQSRPARVSGLETAAEALFATTTASDAM